MNVSIDLEIIGDYMLMARAAGPEYHYLDTTTGLPKTLSEATLAAIEDKKKANQALTKEEDEHQRLAEKILKDDDFRFIQFDEIDPATELTWMTDFSEMVGSQNLYKKLKAILEVTSIVAKFRELIAKHPAEYEMWMLFANGKKQAEAAAWLNSVGIEEGGQFRFMPASGRDRNA